MNILLYNSDKNALNNLGNVIRNHILINEYFIRIKISTNDIQDIIMYQEKHNLNYDLIFLDISLAKDNNLLNHFFLLKELSPNLKIIFTARSEVEISEISPFYNSIFGYLILDNQEYFKKSLYRYLDLFYIDCSEKLNKDKQKLSIKTDSYLTYINKSDIFFIETSYKPHKVIIHTHKDAYETYGSLKKYENICPFLYRAHQSYLINLNKVQTIDFKKRVVKYENNLESVVSSNKVNDIKIKFSKLY